MPPKGLRAARNHEQLDVVIVDRGLPDRDGMDVVAELRTQLSSLPVIVASGYGDSLDHATLRNDPHIRFMSKPYDIDALTTALRALHVRHEEMREVWALVRYHRGRFDLHLRALLHERDDLHDRHRRIVPADHVAVGSADLLHLRAILVEVRDEPREAHQVLGTAAGLREQRDDILQRLPQLARRSGC